MSVKMGKLRFVALAFAVGVLGCSGGEEGADRPAAGDSPPTVTPEGKGETPPALAEPGQSDAPKEVLVRFANALANGDRVEALACLDKSTPAARTLVTVCESAMILLEKTAEFQKAVAAKFGDETASGLSFLSGGGNVVEQLRALKDQISAGRVEVDGERAKVAVQGLPEGALSLIRKDERWYVQLAASSSIAAGDERFKAERDLFDRTIAEASAALKKSSSAEALRSELDRIQARMLTRRLAIQAAAGSGVPRTN